MGIVVVVAGEGELFEVVLALHAVGRLAHLLHGGQQQPDEDGNNGDHDQQFDERETHQPVADLLEPWHWSIS
jgi:hypothetical protein